MQRKSLIKQGIKLYTEHDTSVFAGYAAMFIVTALFPFVMLLISVVGLFPGFSAMDLEDVLYRLLPDVALVRDMISSVIRNLEDQASGLLASAAAVATLWSASKGVSAIQKGLNHLDREEGSSTEEEDSSGTKGKIKNVAIDTGKRLLFTLLLVILIPALLVFEMLGSSVENAVHHALEQTNTEEISDLLSKIGSFFHVGSPLVLIFAFLVILATYALLPPKRRSLKSQLPGAVFTVVCWAVFTRLFSFFIPRFFNSSLYGSLASVFLLLLWVWIMVIILFVGKILNRVLEQPA